MAAGVFILIIVLLVVGFRGCLNARKERGFENYVSDLSSIAAETQNLSKSFFGRLEDPGDLTPLQFEAEIKADRGAMEGLLDRSEGLDAPDELAEAQDLIVLSYELRRDGLASVSESIAAALGDEGSEKAVDVIADEMRTFLASDVIYSKGQEGIQSELTAQEVVIQEGEDIATQFLPAEPDWLDPDVVADALGGLSGSRGPAAPGVHGLGLVEGGVTLQPTGATLAEGVPVTAAADGAELEVEVQNQGESEETGVIVSYEISGGGSGAGEETIDSIAAEEIATVNLPLEGVEAGTTVELTVTAEPVPGEEIEDNNSITASVTFE
ncbi:MAG: hypothetical protein ACR2OC_03700 [Solirubrobacterales bacterium]